ncbi:MAG: tRNA-guanine transglycosylase, partial [Planctomycetota bacterium]
MSEFEVLYRDSGSSGRRGLLNTSHGKVETPAFMPVGTAGAVKGISPQQLKETGADIVLANTYHLLVRPGVDVVEALGGVHKLMAWNSPILTDSGGYQIFSLSGLTKVDNDGVEFASHVDGAKIYLNAESATEIQNRFGADIIMCFDECAPYGANLQQLTKTVERTIRWAERCKQAHGNSEQRLFAIVQGGINPEL